MAKQISYQPLTDIGLNGLNTQSNPATLDTSFLTKAENVVIRESGRIAFRKGLKQKVAPSGTAIGSMIEHNDQGTNKVFASHGTSIYTVDFTTPNAAFPSSGADVKHTVGSSTGAWQFIEFNRRLTCIHENIVPQRYDGSQGSGSKWAAFDNAHRPAGVSSGEFKPSCGMGFYGRMWVGGVAEEKDVLYYSTLLDSDDFRTTAVNGASNGGYIDLKSVWGVDDIIAIAPFMGKLVVFGANNIAIYDSPNIIGSMALNEVIRGVGCVSRDSVQAIGDDLVFLSSTGLRSLGRTTEKDKLPMQDLSLNIKDTLIRNVGQSTNAKAVYVENEGIYILSFVNNNITYVFDFKHFTPNQAPRITTWTFNDDREPSSLAYTELYGLLVGQKDGSLAGYEGYYDSDLAANGSTVTNASYTSSIATTWINLGQSVAASLLKRLFMVLEGGSGANLGLKWYKDYSPSPSATTQITLNPVTTGTPALWGASTSLYGKSGITYKPVFGLQEYKTPLTGSAKNLKLEIDITSNGFDASLQDLTLLHKQGKIR
tara:strand:- start:135 stop:1754 length:1620 start_codon:yes stop_codon:yes gene_type:complete